MRAKKNVRSVKINNRKEGEKERERELESGEEPRRVADLVGLKSAPKGKRDKMGWQGVIMCNSVHAKKA